MDTKLNQDDLVILQCIEFTFFRMGDILVNEGRRRFYICADFLLKESSHMAINKQIFCIIICNRLLMHSILKSK